MPLEIIGSALKRDLKIIRHLYKNREVSSIEELVQLNGVSEKTIQTDIERINKNFSMLHIKIGSKAQLKLECSDNVGLEYVYREVMDMSIEFDVFEYLLIEPKRSINFYINKLFISESLFRRIVHKWNKVFERKELSILIVTSPVVSVKGDEIAIRQLYNNFLIEKYGGDVREIFLKKGSVWELITHIKKALSVEIVYSNQLKYASWAFVCIHRMKCGYFIEEKHHIETGKEISKFIYSKISKNIIFMEQFKYNYQVSISVEMLLDIGGIFDYDLLLLGRLTKDISSYEQKETGLSMKGIEDFLFSLYESIHYENLSLEQTLTLIYSSLIYRFRIPFFLYDRYEEFREYIKRESFLFLTMFEYHLEKSNLPNYLKEKEEFKNEFLYYVVIHTNSLLDTLPKLVARKKIIILTTFHNNYENSLKEKIENKFAGRLSVSLYHLDQLQFDIDYLNQFDIILSNYEHLSTELGDKIIFWDMGAPTELFKKIERKLR